MEVISEQLVRSRSSSPEPWKRINSEVAAGSSFTCENTEDKIVAYSKAKGLSPYHHLPPPDPSFYPSMSICEYISKYSDLLSGQRLEDVTVSLCGMTTCHEPYMPSNFYESSYDVRNPPPQVFSFFLRRVDSRVLVMADARDAYMDKHTFFTFYHSVRQGRPIGISGVPGKSEKNDLVIFPKSYVYSWSPRLPKAPAAPAPAPSVNLEDVEDPETRLRLEMFRDREFKPIIITRKKIIKFIGNFLAKNKFLKVNTPQITRMTAPKIDVPGTHFGSLYLGPEFPHLRPSIDLWIAQMFRGLVSLFRKLRIKKANVNNNHISEFYACEFYMDFDYEDLMELTEQMLSGMVKHLTGGYKIISYDHGLKNFRRVIDFTPPFRRIDLSLVVEELRACGELSEIPTYSEMLDKLGEGISSMYAHPAFIINYPKAWNPLAKCQRTELNTAECFELFINKHKVCNGYTALDDPLLYRQIFSEQLKDCEELNALNRTTCPALESGLPATGGWALNMNALTMLLIGHRVEEEVNHSAQVDSSSEGTSNMSE